MNSFSNLIKNGNNGQIMLSILFSIYLIMGYKMPEKISELIDTIYGKIIVVVIALILFSYTNPILGVLGF